MEGKILAICLSEKKGTKKREVDSARLIADWGIEGDGHAGPGHRQVSLLSIEEIDKMKKFIPTLSPGDFAENVVTKDINLEDIKIGDRILIKDDVVLEVSQIGKECHSGCEIQRLTGQCIMPKKGIFAKVLSGGLIEKNDFIRIQKLRNENCDKNDENSKIKSN